MDEATRLTRVGRVADATALIQRALAGDESRGEPFVEGTRVDATTGPAPAEPPRQIGVDAADARAARPIPATVRRVPAARPVGAPFVNTDALRLPNLEEMLKRGPAMRPPRTEKAWPGRWISGTYRDGHGSRDYKLYVPTAYRGQALPLVVMLHGCTQDADDFPAGTRMNDVAEAEGFLVAYPAQPAAANPNRCWNWFEPAHQQRSRGEPALIAGMTRQVVAEYGADADRVYVAGLSAGGAMAAILATAYPDLYAAVGVHSGLAPGCAHDLPSAFQAMKRVGRAPQADSAHVSPNPAGRTAPLIVFHGDRDTTVHPGNADDLVRHWAAAAAGPAPSGATHPHVRVRQGQSAGGRAYTCAAYLDGRGRTFAERWTIHGAGHAWSGGSRDGSYTDPAGPDASREMARFFREHPRDRR